MEAEHGQVDSVTNVTDDNPLTTGKIALAHLNEIPDYYTRFQQMEAGTESTKKSQITSTAVERNGKWALAKRLAIGLALLVFGAISSRFFRKGRAKTG